MARVSAQPLARTRSYAYTIRAVLSKTFIVLSFMLQYGHCYVEGHVMAEAVYTEQTALKYEVEVQDHGRVELHVPFSSGARVVVFVIPEPADTFDDLVAASESSLAFWNDPIDDEDWNNA
jgi:hypothetical protein